MRSVVVLGGLCIAMICGLLTATQTTSTPLGKLAYVQNGEVWIKTLPDGVPRKISKGPPADSPRWSASGQWVSFLQTYHEKVQTGNTFSDINQRWFTVVSARDDAQDQRPVVSAIANNLRDDPAGVWSPTRDELAFAGKTGIRIVPASGAPERIAFEPSKGQTVGCCPSWSADGNLVAFIVVNGEDRQLWTVHSDGSQAQQVSGVHSPGLEGPFGWSGDNRFVLMRFNPDHSASIEADGIRLFSIAAKDGVTKPLIPDDVLMHTDYTSASAGAPDILVIGGGDRSAWTNKRLIMINPSTGSQVVLTDKKTIPAGARRSPDGSVIAYSAGPDGGGVGGGEEAKKALAQRHLWIVNADGSQRRQLTSDANFRDENPIWTQDGQFIIFARMNAESAVSVWSINVHDGTLTRLVDQIMGPAAPTAWFGYYGYIDWPDAIAFSGQ